MVELKSQISDMKNWPIKHPSTSSEPGLEGEKTLEALFKTQSISSPVQEWYREIERGPREWNEEIWTNIGKKHIGFYSPERAFVSPLPRANALFIECFSRGEPLGVPRSLA